MNFERLLCGLPVEPLAAKLAANPDWWNAITLRQDFLGSPHYDTETIFLRGPAGFSFEAYFQQADALDYHLLSSVMDELMPVLRPLLLAIDWQELGRILLVRMPPGAALDEHTDEGHYAETYARFHVPLVTNPGCSLTVDRERQHMEAGEAWWFDHRRPHSAHNTGETARIHLIVDAVSARYKTGRHDGPCDTGPIEPHDGGKAGAAGPAGAEAAARG
jgi:quercetin dioxygenase-like cupin family protein